MKGKPMKLEDVFFMFVGFTIVTVGFVVGLSWLVILPTVGLLYLTGYLQ